MLLFVSFLNFLIILKLTFGIDNPFPNDNRYKTDRFRIAMASCIYQQKPSMPLWQYFPPSEADVIILLGDNVYLDQIPCQGCDIVGDFACFNLCWDEVTWYLDPITQYNILLNHSDFNLNKQIANYSNWPPPTLLIWDDHDFGKDNGDQSVPYKNITKDGFIYFWEQIDLKNNFTNIREDIANNDSRGVYYYYDMSKNLTNVSSIYSNDSSRIITIRFYQLDCRWYRNGSDLLGEEQKEWFEQLILNETIDYHIVSTGSVFMLNFTIAGLSPEFWPDNSREWFLNVTNDADIQNKTILLSGDVHFSTVSHFNATFEIVTSSFTHSLPDSMAYALEEIDLTTRVTNIINQNNFAILDIGFDGFEMTYINNDGKDLILLSYEYENNTLTYEVYDWHVNHKLLSSMILYIMLAMFICYCGSVVGISYCICLRSKKNTAKFEAKYSSLRE